MTCIAAYDGISTPTANAGRKVERGGIELVANRTFTAVLWNCHHRQLRQAICHPGPAPGPPDAQCEVAESNRRECGYFGIDEGTCVNDGCCWRESYSSGVPWCYTQASSPAPSPGTRCQVPDDRKQDCGFFGIDESGCEARGCCWQESQSGAPWCFNAQSYSFLQPKVPLRRA